MRTSDSVDKISAALLEAQKRITFAHKDANNPFFKSKYADLPTVIDAVKPALNDCDIAFIQAGSPCESGLLALTTRLQHSSGQWIEDTAIVPLSKADPQGFGSAMTYARRYSLAAMTGLYQDDDDGNAASIKPSIQQPRALTPAQVEEAFPDLPMPKAIKTISEKQRKLIWAKCRMAAIPDNVFKVYIKENFHTEHTADLPWQAMDKIIKWVDAYNQVGN